MVSKLNFCPDFFGRVAPLTSLLYLRLREAELDRREAELERREQAMRQREEQAPRQREERMQVCADGRDGRGFPCLALYTHSQHFNPLALRLQSRERRRLRRAASQPIPDEEQNAAEADASSNTAD